MASPVSQPVVVNGCFGWFHCNGAAAAANTAASETAILLCPALGWDGLHAHHGFRLLADALAARGYPVLRFQYPGTADSADLASGAEPWAAWQQSVHDCADWLRANTGASRLVLAGLRVGATLATVVAESRSDVEALLLLAPVLRGKSYMRQLDMEARLEGGIAPDPEQAPGLAFHELLFSPETVGIISSVDLRHAKIRAGAHIAIFPQAASQLADACVQAWTKAGAHVRSIAFEGLEPLLQEAIHVDPPAPDFSRLLEWVTLNVPPHDAMLRGPVPPLRAAPVLRLAGCSEVPLRFGAEGRLFGILCRPDAPVAKMAVVIGNTGRDPHYGIARFGVELARQLAAEGIASLRMDFAGLGDSPALPNTGHALSSLFDADRTPDFKAAMDALQQHGYTSFALQGVCSGAYHAFRAAQDDARVRSLLLVNLPVFEWSGGDSVKEALWKYAPASRLVTRVADPAVWRRVLRGQVDLARIARAQGARLIGRVLPRFRAAPLNQGARMMQLLSKRGARSLLLYSAGDPGMDVIERDFGPGGKGLLALPGAELRVEPGMDHVLSAPRMRRIVADQLVSFLTAHGPTPRPER